MTLHDCDRSKGVGGSELAAVLGLSPYQTPLDVYLKKVGAVDDDPESEPMRIGNVMEPVLIAEFERRMEVQVAGRGRHLDDAHGFGHLDGVVTMPDGDAVVEAKNVGRYSKRLSAWGPEGSDVVPQEVQVQCQRYMDLAEADIAYVIAFLAGAEFALYTLPRSEKLITKLRGAVDRFMEEHVHAENPPAPVNVADAKKAYQYTEYGKTIQLAAGDADALRSLSALKVLRGQKKQLGEAIGEPETWLRKTIADGEQLIDQDGRLLATLTDRHRTGVDLKRLEKEFPEAFGACKKVTSTRTLLLKDKAIGEYLTACIPY